MEVEIQGIPVHYKVVGEGRPIVMLHGGGLDHRHMVDELEPVFVDHPDWKRIYPDLPGHGKTPVTDSIFTQEHVLNVILEFIDRVLPGQTFAIAGLSRGGYLARGVIYKRPDSIDGALLIVPASAIAGASEDLPHTTLVKDPALASELRPGEANRFGMLVVQNREILERMRATHFPADASSDKAHRKRIAENYDLSFDVNALARPMPKPVLIITGAQDDVVGFRDAWKMMDVFPRATFATLDRAGHMLPFEQEILFRVLAAEWLQRVEECSGRRPD